MKERGLRMFDSSFRERLVLRIVSRREEALHDLRLIPRRLTRDADHVVDRLRAFQTKETPWLATVHRDDIPSDRLASDACKVIVDDDHSLLIESIIERRLKSDRVGNVGAAARQVLKT